MEKIKLKKSTFDIVDHLINKSLKTSVSSLTDRSIFLSGAGPALILKFISNKAIRSNFDSFSIAVTIKNDLLNKHEKD
jgi:hypothetical protein